ADELFNFGGSQRPSMATRERERNKRSNEEPEATQTGSLWGLEESRSNSLPWCLDKWGNKRVFLSLLLHFKIAVLMV
ncbi:MAG: hypothetical protein LGB58_07930, partial [Sulfurovum sp.]|nr:hypothetical protein [Sulfurovum sp.]